MIKKPFPKDQQNSASNAGADPFRISFPAGASPLSEAYIIRSYEVDAGGRLSLPSLCNFMQDAAGKHADEMGISVAHLQKEGKTWMLSRMALEMKAYPGWQDTFRVTTWPSGSRRLFALRNFLFHDGQKRLLGSAATAWLIIDTRHRRPLRVEPFLKKMGPGTSAAEIEIQANLFEKIPRLDAHDQEVRFRIRYRDLDTNRHVNNVSFIEWVVESMPAEELHRAMLTGLEINYVAEAFHGDFVVSKSRPLDGQPGSFLHCIVKEDGGQELIRARTVWKAKPS